MHPKIEEYLAKQESAVQKQNEAAKKDFLLKEGLFEKEYAPDDTWSEEYSFSDYDSEQQKTRYYKKLPIEISDEEFDRLRQCRRAAQSAGSTGQPTGSNSIATVLLVIAWLTYIAGAIAFLYFALSEEDVVPGLSFALGAFISGSLFLGFAEVIKLLTAIKNR